MEKKTFTTPNGIKFTVEYSGAIQSGYGHKRIEVTIVDEQGDVETFASTTNNMPAYDDATELEGQEKYEALYEIVSGSIDVQIDEWHLDKAEIKAEDARQIGYINTCAQEGKRFITNDGELFESITLDEYNSRHETSHASWDDVNDDYLLDAEELINLIEVNEVVNFK